MMKAIMPMVSALIFIACFIKTAYSIQCYVCESSEKQSCGPDFKAEDAFKVNCSVITPPRYIVNLSGNNFSATGCSKSITEVMGAKVVKRGCNFGDPKDKVYPSKAGDQCITAPSINIDSKTISCDVCHKDYCNGSSTITVAGLTVAFAIFLRFFLSY